MRWPTGFLILAVAGSRLSAQSLISRDSITREWALRHLIGGIDSPAPGIGKTWPCVKSWPEVTGALTAVYKQADSKSLVAADAVLMLGATGQDSAFRFLITLLDSSMKGDQLRQTVLLALGNSADPPGYVYDRLELILASGPSADAGMAMRALSDIRSSRASAVLRKTRAATTNDMIVAAIDGTLSRMDKGHPRIVSPCDSTILAHDHE